MIPRWTALLATALAFAGPMLLAFNAPPSPTLLNGLASLGLCGAWTMIAASGLSRSTARDDGLLQAAIVAVLLGLLWSALRSLPLSIALGLAAPLLASSLLARTGNLVGQRPQADTWFVDFCWALCAAGLVSAVIGCVQVFAPDLPDGDWIARSGMPGRAVGNLRQPNHLSTLLLCAAIALVALRERRRLRAPMASIVAGLLLFALVLTGSRTGILGVFMLALWGLLDRRLARGARAALVGSPVLFAVIWFGLSAWSHVTAHAFGGEGRLGLGHGDISSSRFGIWSNTLSMIGHEPWTGVGLGEFNVAWTLSAFPDRPTAFFDHTHNLALQVMVEFGLPLGLLVIALLLAALAQAWRRAWSCDGDEGVAKRAAFMIVLMIGLHSMLEYPLWYAYFLLPTAFAWGFALAKPTNREDSNLVPPASPPPAANRALVLAGLAMTVGAAAAVLDYRSVVVIYDPPDNAAPLEERIARGQRSPLFGHHADYAAATAFGEPKAPLSPSQELAFRRAPHQLLDIRLMIAWSQALAAQGELDKARWLAARIREFRNPGADEYFAPCKDPGLAAQAFQCRPPTRVVNWREFIQH